MIGPMRPSNRLLVIGLLTAFSLAACATPTPTPTAVPTASPSPSPSPSPTPTPAPTAVPTPAPIPLNAEMLGKRLTILIVGEDISAYRLAHGTITARTDAIMVVSVSPDQSKISMISLPRDTVDVPLGDGRVFRQKVNGIMQKYGIDALRKAMAALLGVPVDHYMMLNMDDFPWMVDAVGGIDVTVQTHVYDPRLNLDIQPGPLHMDGALALSFSRTREYDSDYERAARQQQVILAIVQKWLTPAGGASLVGAMRFLGSLRTDLVMGDVPTLLEIGRRSADAAVSRVVLTPPRFGDDGIDTSALKRGWVMIPNLKAIRSYARSVMAD